MGKILNAIGWIFAGAVSMSCVMVTLLITFYFIALMFQDNGIYPGLLGTYLLDAIPEKYIPGLITYIMLSLWFSMLAAKKAHLLD